VAVLLLRGGAPGRSHHPPSPLPASPLHPPLPWPSLMASSAMASSPMESAGAERSGPPCRSLRMGWESSNSRIDPSPCQGVASACSTIPPHAGIAAAAAVARSSSSSRNSTAASPLRALLCRVIRAPSWCHQPTLTSAA